MRILLIRPAQIRWHDEARRIGTATGLLSLAAVLRAQHFVEFIDAAVEGYDEEIELRPGVLRFGLTDDAVLRRIDDFAPDIVGISNLFTLYWGTTFQLLSRIKRHAPTVITILGGHHASEAADEILLLDQERVIDYIVLREGEETLLELVRAIEESKPVANIRGIAYRGPSGDPCATPPRPLIAHVDRLPDPAWDLLDPRLHRAEMSHHGPPLGANFIDVTFSRGCPIACSFCTSTSYWGSRFRVLTEERAQEQLAKIAHLGWQEIVVEDDNFSALPFDVQRYLCNALKDTRLPWCNDGGLYLPLLDGKRVALLAETGCYRVFLPVETPKVATIQAQNKYRGFRDDNAFLNKIREVTGLLRDAHIEFYSALMVGFPSDTRKSLQHACDFAEYLINDCGAFGVAFHWVHDYPGTRNYRHGTVPAPWHDEPERYTFTRPSAAFRDQTDFALEMRRRYPQPSRDAARGILSDARQDCLKTSSGTSLSAFSS